MSMMLPEGPAQSITLGGAAQQTQQGQQGGGDGPDSVRVIGLVRRAKALLQQALVLENLQQTGARVSLALRRLDQTGAIPTEPVTPDSVAAQWMRLGGNVSAR